MKILIVYGLLTLFSIANISRCESGIFKLKFGNEFLEKMLGLITDELVEEVYKYKANLPDIQIKKNILSVFPIRVNVSKSLLDELESKEHEIKISHASSDKVRIQMNKLRLRGSAEYDYQAGFVPSTNGRVYFDIFFSFDIYVTVKSTDKKFLSLTLSKIGIDHKFNDFSLNAGFLAQVFAANIGWFRGSINGHFEKVVSKILENVLENVETNLQSTINIPALNSAFGIKMNNNIFSTPNYFEFDYLVASEEEGGNSEFLKNTPIQKNSYKSTDINSDNIQISLDTALIEKLFRSAIKNQRQFVVSKENVPKEIPIKIDTNYFQAMFPTIDENYPDKDLIITFDLDSYPTAKLNNELQSLDLEMSLSMSLALEEDPSISIISISTGMLLSLVFDGSKENNSVLLRINKVEIQDIYILNSTFPQGVEADDLKMGMNFLFSSLTFVFNNYLRINPIPVSIIDGLKFHSINVNVTNGDFLEISCKPDLEKTTVTQFINTFKDIKMEDK